jgi:hypothetical protein
MTLRERDVRTARRLSRALVDNEVHPLSHGYGEAVSFRPGDIVYADESKARDYIVVSTSIAPADRRPAEQALRALLKPGQRRLHFKSESDSRRRVILSRMVELPVQCSIWIMSGSPDKVARPRILRALATAAMDDGVSHLVLERDESLEASDRRQVAEIARQRGSDLRYSHSAPQEHPLLWVSDAVAWCHSRGGDWVRRADPIVGCRVERP